MEKPLAEKDGLRIRELINCKFIMARQSGKIGMTLSACKMLSWPFGITQNQQMKIPIMISVPPGEQSWCGFKRDISKGTADYVHKSPIPEAVADAIYPTFEALSDESLLS